MNFLGHMYLSDSDHQLMLDNLFGDFVKGSDLSRFPESVQKGIRLHRSIDDFIDHHPQVLNLVHQLRPALPKVAAVAVDLYFDHLLAKNWKHFYHLDLNQYLEEFYQSVETNEGHYPVEFREFMQKMIRHNWMAYYHLEEGLHKACNGVASRLSFKTELVNGLYVFRENRKIIEETFTLYMRDAIVKFGIASSK